MFLLPSISTNYTLTKNKTFAGLKNKHVNNPEVFHLFNGTVLNRISLIVLMAWREQISVNLLKVNNENTRTMCKIYSKLEKKKSYRTKLRKRHSRVFIANFV